MQLNRFEVPAAISEAPEISGKKKMEVALASFAYYKKIYVMEINSTTSIPKNQEKTPQYRN